MYRPVYILITVTALERPRDKPWERPTVPYEIVNKYDVTSHIAHLVILVLPVLTMNALIG